MTRFLMTASAAALLDLAACNDTEDDVVQAPTPGAPPAPVSETRAETAQTTTALALGMTRDELEDSDLVSADYTDLGDVETLVLSAAGEVESIVVELEGPGDRQVLVPIGSVSSITRNDEKDVTTTLTARELAALPAWDGARP